MNSEMIEEFVSRIETFGGWDRSDLEEIYQEGFDAGEKAALQWQPIETAPKDEGSIVLGFDKADGVVSMILERYLDGLVWERNFDEGRHYSDIEPTHWIPLPPAPEVSE